MDLSHLNPEDMEACDQFFFLEHLMLGHEVNGEKGPDVYKLGGQIAMDDMIDELMELASNLTGHHWWQDDIGRAAICAAAEGANHHQFASWGRQHWTDMFQDIAHCHPCWIHDYRREFLDNILTNPNHYKYIKEVEETYGHGPTNV
jgi:hypothetical protein